MRRLAVLLGAAALLAGGCGGGAEPGAEAEPAPIAAEQQRASIETSAGGTAELTVEVVDTPEDRAVGLMHRESMPEDHGMLFVFETQIEGPFWMKNTLIPLSIAFLDADGRILRILDMEPCREDPCPHYTPGVTYDRALEVNQGAFGRWGVATGDVFRLDG